MTLEARVIINGGVHAVRGFVYLECFLVLTKKGYQGERVTDPARLEFQLFIKGADWRALPVRGVAGSETTWRNYDYDTQADQIWSVPAAQESPDSDGRDRVA